MYAAPSAPIEAADPVPCAGHTYAGFERLAYAAASHADPGMLTGDVLALLVESLDVGLAFMARVEGPLLIIERVLDRAGMGLEAGASVALCDTY